MNSEDFITTEILDEGLGHRIEQLRQAFIATGREGDARTIVEDESRKFARQVMILAPAPGLGGKAKLSGERAVATDLMRIFTPVNEQLLDMLGSAHGTRNVDAWFETKEKAPVHVVWDRIDPSGAGMAAFHKANRNKRGRTKNLKAKRVAGAWYSPYVVSYADFDAYKRKVQNRVGLRKAAWAKSFVGLGGYAQRWISRHLAYAKGRFINHITDPLSPGIRMGNHSAGIMNDESQVRSAFKIRARAIIRRIKFVFSGYSADMMNKAKTSRKERRTASGLEDFAMNGAGYE